MNEQIGLLFGSLTTEMNTAFNIEHGSLNELKINKAECWLTFN